MKQPPRKPSADPYRKARFREEARGIGFKDRDDRKYGRGVDTAGAIARALERAYRQGFADAQDDPVPKTSVQPRPDGPLNWALIPPRPEARSGPAAYSRSDGEGTSCELDISSPPPPNVGPEAGASSWTIST